MRTLMRLASALVMLAIATPGHTYIGPGAGAGVIAVVLGVITSFVLALVAVVWYPLKRLYRRIRPPAEQPEKIGADAK